MGTWKVAAWSAGAVLVLAGVALGVAAEASARQRDSGCKAGPIKNMSELDDRVAACTIAIDRTARGFRSRYQRPQ